MTDSLLAFKLEYAALQNISYLFQKLLKVSTNKRAQEIEQLNTNASDGIYIIPLVPPITLLIEDPISLIVSAASLRG